MIGKINIAAKHAQFDAPWSPKRIAKVDNYDIKLAKGEGAFDWHKHDEEDEMFLVTQGVLRIEIEGQDDVVLEPGELCVIPKGVQHNPVCVEEPVHIMLFEKSGVTNTGDNEDSDLTQELVDL